MATQAKTAEAGTEKVARRQFLKFAGLSAAAGGAALVSGNGEAAASADAPTAEGYRETEHVKTYYRLAAF